MPKALRAVLRVAVAIGLLAVAIALVGPDRLRQQWQHVDRAWLGAAVIAAALAQWVSVLRWETIARIFGLKVRTAALALAYAQGMTLNVLLPGATLGGDALRSIRLQRLGNPLAVSALTVLLDRLSGLWVLCVLSLATGAILAISLLMHVAPAAIPLTAGALDASPDAPLGSQAMLPWLGLYLLGLALACAAPWIPVGVGLGRGADPARRGASDNALLAFGLRVWRRVCELHDLALAQRRALGRSLWSSVLVQVLCALTLWLCVLAAGGGAGYWQVQAVAAPVFVAGALPISYGGFGAREITALVAFPLVGLPAEMGLSASALYGIVAIILGLLAAPSFALAGSTVSGKAGS